MGKQTVAIRRLATKTLEKESDGHCTEPQNICRIAGCMLKAVFAGISEEHQAELERYVSPPGWRTISWSSLPSVLSLPYREKLDSAILIAAPTSTGGAYMTFTLQRVDIKDRAVDQDVFGLIVHSTGVASVGMYVYHGDWPGRTIYPPTEFWAKIDESGIGDYYLTYPPAGIARGTLDQLPGDHRDAFNAFVAVYRSNFPEES